ncbi:MAG: translocation/assembly module TamB domain-containing protein, partial [Casimicrobiaceae bacterium]
RVRVTSNPPVPENEALAWLITGEAPSSGRGDMAALSAATAALLSSGGQPLTTRIAQTFGLDDISVRGSGARSVSANPNAAAGQVIVFGKRITEKLTVGYEQGLSIATNALRIEYALSNTLTLRVEAGTISGVGIVYRHAFD